MTDPYRDPAASPPSEPPMGPQDAPTGVQQNRTPSAGHTSEPPPYRGRPVPEPLGVPTPQPPILATRRERTGPEQTRRVLLFAFGIVQLLIGLRIVLVLIAARTDNAIVGTILDASDFLVAPFRGILQTNVAESGAIVLDLAAVVALIGWTILELMLYWAIGLFRRDAA